MNTRPSDIDNTGLVRRHIVTNFELPNGTKVAKAYSNKYYIDYVVNNLDTNEISINNFLRNVSDKILSIFEHELVTRKSFKCNMFLSVQYVNIIDVTMRFAYKSKNSVLHDIESAGDFLENHITQLLHDVETRDLLQSGWSLLAIQHLEIRISHFKPIPGRGFIPLPKWITLKGAVLSIKNNNDLCFKYAILAIYLRKIGQKVTFPNFRKYEKTFDFGINFPPLKKDILKFCSLNKVSCHIFGLESTDFYPIIISKKIENSHFNVLYYEQNGKAHYYPIINLSRLLSSQIDKHEKAKFFCLRCLLYFASQHRLDVHTTVCGNETLSKVLLPEKEYFFKFDRYDAIQQNYLIMSLDFECFLVDIDTCQPDEYHSSTTFIQKHELASYGVYLKCLIDTPDTRKIPCGYVGKISKNSRALEASLVEYFQNIATACKPFFMCDYPMDLSAEQELDFQNSTFCYICYKPFTVENYRVRDHCHSIPKHNYRGSSHLFCNLAARKRHYIPCYVHCLSQYDSHILVKLFTEYKFPLRIVPHNVEKYISFEVVISGVTFRFVDSYLLFHEKLETVLQSLPKEYFFETKKYFPENTHKYIMEKLSFPYSFLSSPANLDHAFFPEKKYFTNDLTGELINDESYAKGKEIWDLFECKNFADFTSLYQSVDTISLIDSVLYLRQILFDKFGVEMSAFLSLAQIAVTCMLKLSKVEIQVFDNSLQEAYDLVSRGMYGGLVTCNTRYIEASDTRIIDVADFNSLYLYILDGYKMPLNGYKFVDVDLKNWSVAITNGEHGYFLEIDLCYDAHTHSILNDLPLACQRKVPPGAKTARLVSDFSAKEHYVVSLPHYQLLLSLGVRVTKIHQVLQYNQDFYMMDYIRIIAQWRKEATNDLMSKLMKNLGNFLIGKLKEDLIGRKTVEIVLNDKRLRKLVRKGTFQQRHLYNYPNFDMILVEMSKPVVFLNRPIIISALVWSLSKVHLYSYWYNILKPTFGPSLMLLGCDTDNYIYSYEPKTNYFDDLQALKEHFDFSNLDPKHILYNTDNKRVLGKLKLESNGKRIIAACFIKSKVYSLLFEDDSSVNKLKGVQRNYVKNVLKFSDYKACVLDKKVRFALFKSIISKEHNLFTVIQRKLALSPQEYKRYILPDGIHTLAHFHHLIPNT